MFSGKLEEFCNGILSCQHSSKCLLHTLLCSFFTVFFLKTVQFNEWKLLCNQTFSHLSPYCFGVTLSYFSAACIGRKKSIALEKMDQSHCCPSPAMEWGIPPHSNHPLYSEEAQHPTSIFFFFPSKHFVFSFHCHSIHNETGKKKQRLSFLFSYSYIISW